MPPCKPSSELQRFFAVIRFAMGKGPTFDLSGWPKASPLEGRVRLHQRSCAIQGLISTKQPSGTVFISFAMSSLRFFCSPAHTRRSHSRFSTNEAMQRELTVHVLAAARKDSICASLAIVYAASVADGVE